jgi:hypothetical protein
MTTQSVGLLWKRDRPVTKTAPDNSQRSQEKNIYEPEEFKTKIPASDRLQTLGLDRSTNGIDSTMISCKMHSKILKTAYKELFKCMSISALKNFQMKK